MAPERPGPGFRLARVLLFVPLLAGAWALLGPPTAEAALFFVAWLGVTVGAFRARRSARRRWMLAGFAAVTGLVVARLVAAAAGATVHDEPSRWLDRVVPERDLALGGTRLLLTTGLMHEDTPGILDHLSDGYDRLRAAEGWVPSPVVGNFLRGPGEHGVLRVTPEAPDPRAALVFLHGYGGSVTLPCWQAAQAAAPLGMETVCPAMDWHGRWGSPRGRATLERTLAELRTRGAERIVVAGLSNGGIGLSQLAGNLDADGLVFLSGVSARARRPRVPTLVLHGGRDSMTSPRVAARWARSLGRRAHYVEVPEAGHWLLLSHHERVTQELRAFLEEVVR